MTNGANDTEASLTHLLALMNQLLMKAFTTTSRKALTFVILNDTRKLVSYDRALLFTVSGQRPKCLGVSGQATVETESPVVREAETRLNSLEHLSTTHTIELDDGASVLWLPIKDGEETILGLWLERWKGPAWGGQQTKVLEHLAQGYGASWKKLPSWKEFSWPSGKKAAWILGSLFVLLFLIPIPLRVVAPCEVVAKDPYLVTAPLEGIIAEMLVKPGEPVKDGQTLFSYDKQVPLQKLKIAEKQVEVTNAQLNRVLTLGLSDASSLNEAAIWKAQLAKDNIELDLAKYHASQLDVGAPSEGVAIFDNPDEWRGKPVKVGERVLVVSRPGQTKVRIWLPERDNILIRHDKPIKVVLNISPLTTLYANLNYIADFSIVTEKGVPSFTAEADWATPQPDIKLGLKGTAILYGENVSLFYWIIRKPWASVRDVLGW
ncbi:MAG: HlyD family efflux transporter periplasmic adaptor subunit [Chlamydiales bacterium]|nr:HlyD family efflux transporter periplasmic adaptor subunit [Chlamydiales bacterium]